MRVLFTGYAPVHFLCFKPLYEALVRTPGVEVQLSGGTRSKSAQAPGGYLYDADEMYNRFGLPEGTVLPVAALTNAEYDVMFSANLVYSGLFQFVNVRQDEIEPLIWIECPRLLFPFSRQIMAEITREGGYPPLMINPIDFTPLYWAELRDRQARNGQPPSAASAAF